MTSTDSKIYVTAHHGMVGRAIMRSLLRQGHTNFVTRTDAELDLTHQAKVDEFFATEKPTQVYVVVTPTDSVQANVINAAFRSGVEKLLLLGSRDNCPYSASQGVNYRSVMHADLYGPGDNYHPDNNHIVPSLIRRFHEAKVSQALSVTIGGSGMSKHEFLYIDDIAAASVFVMNQPNTTLDSNINVGFGSDITLKELTLAIGKTVGYQGDIDFDDSKPDDSPRESTDSHPINALGWSAQVGLDAGLTAAYQDFQPGHDPIAPHCKRSAAIQLHTQFPHLARPLFELPPRHQTRHHWLRLRGPAAGCGVWQTAAGAGV